jgi:hypothetical protein
MTPEVTKTVLNKIILKRLDRKWTSITIWPRDRASISVQQLCIAIWQSRQVSCQLANIEGATCPRTYMVFIT